MIYYDIIPKKIEYSLITQKNVSKIQQDFLQQTKQKMQKTMPQKKKKFKSKNESSSPHDVWKID